MPPLLAFPQVVEREVQEPGGEPGADAGPGLGAEIESQRLDRHGQSVPVATFQCGGQALGRRIA